MKPKGEEEDRKKSKAEAKEAMLAAKVGFGGTSGLDLVNGGGFGTDFGVLWRSFSTL